MSIYKTTLTGAAGEHYVMFQLLRQGYIAGLAPQGAPNADIIVSNVKGDKSVSIQVKTSLMKGADKGWHMKAKHELIKGKNLFYCMLAMPEDDTKPCTYVIPANIVADVLSGAHKLWRELPGKNGKEHNDTDMRRLLPDYKKTLKVDHLFTKNYGAGWLDEYKENWKLLGLN